MLGGIAAAFHALDGVERGGAGAAARSDQMDQAVDGIFSAAQDLGRLRHDIFAEEIAGGFIG